MAKEFKKLKFDRKESEAIEKKDSIIKIIIGGIAALGGIVVAIYKGVTDKDSDK